MSKRKIWENLIVGLLCVFVIGWNIYSYLCIGVIHQYDMFSVKQSVIQIELLNDLWLYMISFLAISCSLLVLCTLVFITNKKLFRIRLVLYLVVIILGLIILYHSNQLSDRLLDISVNNTYEIDFLLKPSYKLCIIVNVLTTIFYCILEYISFRVHSAE